MIYRPNNIDFRVVSSKSIEKFKNAQTFALNEVSISSFSVSAKEILLLSYDRAFQLVLVVERILLNQTEVTPETIKHIAGLLEDKQVLVNTIMDTNPDVFENEFVRVWKKVHEQTFLCTYERVLALTTTEPIEFMVDFTGILVSMLAHTIFELHELENVLNGHDLFISIDCFCEDLEEGCLATSRLKEYMKITGKKEVTLKNYLVVNPNEYLPIPTKVFTAIKKLGATVKEIIE